MINNRSLRSVNLQLPKFHQAKSHCAREKETTWWEIESCPAKLINLPLQAIVSIKIKVCEQQNPSEL